MNHCLILLLLLFCRGNNHGFCGNEDCGCGIGNVFDNSCGCGTDAKNDSCRDSRSNSCRDSRNDSCRENRNDSCRERSFGSFTPGSTCGCEEKNN